MDKDFKNGLAIEGFEKRKSASSYGEFYTPDVVLENEDTVIFFESSSSSDRKVHIGELTQFLTYVNLGEEKKENIYFVLFLCGNSVNPPTVDKEYERLHYYYQNFSMRNNCRAKIKGLYIAKQENVNVSNLTVADIKKYKRIDEEA